MLRAPASCASSPPRPPRVARARTVAKATADLVRVHDRLLKLEARVDLLLRKQQHSPGDGGGGAADEAAAAAAATAAAAVGDAAGAAQDEVAAIAEEQTERDIRWRVRDAVEDTFAAGWEARRGGEGGGRVAAPWAVSAAAAAAAAAAAPAVALRPPPKPAAAAASPSRPAAATVPTTPVNVEFVVRCPYTAYGERVWLCGGAAALGRWRPAAALRLRWGEGGCWHAVARLEARQEQEKEEEGDDEGDDGVEFKALLRRDDDATDKGGRWEARERNRRLRLRLRTVVRRGGGDGDGGASGGFPEEVVKVRASEGMRTSVLEDGTVRVEFEAGF